MNSSASRNSPLAIGGLFLALCFALIWPGNMAQGAPTASEPVLKLEGALVASPTSEPPAEIRHLREKLKEAGPAFTASEAERFYKDVLPLVEKVAGRTFKKPPKLRLANRRQIFEVLERDLRPQLENLLHGPTKEQMTEIIQRQALSLAPLLLGKYGFEDRILYLLPNNFEPLFRIMKMDVNQLLNIAKLFTAHELTHALQDQEIDLRTRLRSISDNEVSLALNATIEGHAMFVMEQIGRELNLDKSVIEASRLFAAGAFKFDDPALQMMNQMIALQYETIYLGGKRFMEHQFSKGGNDQLWKVLANPPQRTSIIFKPETYAQGESLSSGPELKPLLAGLEVYLGTGSVQVQNVEVGMLNLQAAYASMDPAKRQELLDGLDRVQALVVIATATRTMGNISLMELKNPASATVLIGHLEEMANQNLEQLKKSSMMTVIDVQGGDVASIPFPIARRLAFSLKEEKGDPSRQVVYRFVKGRLIVECFDGNVRIPEALIASLAQTIFQRYENAGGK